ncbi:ATP-binding protein [Streptomyces sp. NPDC005925]|uniref:ATP-binding protein n=1 Tax=Streptomyces sp. NPDC005925 TaxID=3157172 RepID=UPI0033DA6936
MVRFRCLRTPLEQGGGPPVLLSRQRRFPRARDSVRAARAFALETLAEWGCVDRCDDVRLCVSELATNALLHGVPPGREFSLTLVADGPLIRVEVRDSGDGIPLTGRGEVEDCGGRGLRLVTALADDFGFTPCPPGKTVWTVFKVREVTR